MKIPLCAWVCLFGFLLGCSREAEKAPSEPLSFSKHVAPIAWVRCAPCHRPGGSGPFSLISYADLRSHAKEVMDVTSRRVMPPWLPDGPRGEFIGDRRLSDSELEILRRWVTE